MDENMTLSEFAEEYKLQERQALLSEQSDLSAANSQLLAQFNEKKELLKKLDNALYFTINSTGVISMQQDDGSINQALVTRTSMQEYARDMIVLTNNSDDSFKDLVLKDRESYMRMELNCQINSVRSYNIVNEEMARQRNELMNREITIKAAMEAMRRIEEYELELKREIEKKQEQEKREQEKKAQENEEKIDYGEMLTRAAVTVLAVEAVHEIKEVIDEHKKAEFNKDAEIVVGNDDILNTSNPNEVSPAKWSEHQEQKNNMVADFKSSPPQDIKRKNEKSEKGEQNKKIKKRKEIER